MSTTIYLPPRFSHIPTGLVNICGSVHKDRDRKKWGKTNDSRSSLMCNGICHGIGEKVFSRVQSFSFTHQNAGAAAHHHRDFIALFIAIDLRLLVAAQLLQNRLWSFKLCESKIGTYNQIHTCLPRKIQAVPSMTSCSIHTLFLFWLSKASLTVLAACILNI